MRLIFTLTICVSCVVCWAQQTNSPPLGNYYWETPLIMTNSSLDGTSLNAIEASVEGQKFYLINNVKVNGANYSVIQIIDYKKNKAPAYYNKYNRDKANDTQLYFRVPEAYIQNHAQQYQRNGTSLAVGVINFPVKFRPQKDKTDFSGGFNLGAAIGIKFRHYTYQKFNWSILSAYSISNINLDSVSVNQNGADLNRTNNFSAFTFSLGLMTEYQKIQAGLFIGWDFLGRINQEQYDWHYNAKPWFSIGFGYAIFSSENPTAPGKANTNNKD